MSRTYKDRTWKINYPDYGIDEYEKVSYEAHPRMRLIGSSWNPDWSYSTNYELDYTKTVTRVFFLKKPGVFSKKKKHADTQYHWQSTPSAWTNMMMNRPMRSAGAQWSKKVLKMVDLEDADPPTVSKKPHTYYW